MYRSQTIRCEALQHAQEEVFKLRHGREAFHGGSEHVADVWAAGSRPEMLSMGLYSSLKRELMV